MGNILKYQNPSSPILVPWKALQRMNFEPIPDPEFTRDRTGMGSIEYFDANNEGITYLNGYHRAHPKPGTDVILYDPNTNDEQDIRLDALHLMPKDPIYGALYDSYLNAAKNSDVMYNAEQTYNKDMRKYGANNVDSFDQYFKNEADGLLRNMFIEGTPEYIKSKWYYPDKKQLEKWNSHLIPYINNIRDYLETGVKPEHVIEPAIVTAYKKGGSIYIKKKNRGKFTDYCGGKVTQECITRGKKSSDPKIRKRATFAANARRWKHLFGGTIPQIIKNIG